jgi:hypothetical protein
MYLFFKQPGCLKHCSTRIFAYLLDLFTLLAVDILEIIILRHCPFNPYLKTCPVEGRPTWLSACVRPSLLETGGTRTRIKYCWIFIRQKIVKLSLTFFYYRIITLYSFAYFILKIGAILKQNINTSNTSTILYSIFK